MCVVGQGRCTEQSSSRSVEEVRIPSQSTRGKQRISVALEDMLETMAPLLLLPKACALHELVPPCCNESCS